MNKNARNALWLALSLSAAIVSSQADARVAIESTRVIYPEGAKEVSIRIENGGATPSLVQAWVDEYGNKGNPSTSKAPFMLLPPVMRVDAGKQQVLRIRFAGAELPQDRESVYSLNVLEVPSRGEAASAGGSMLNVAVRNRVKLFYRPQALSKINPTSAIESLHWNVAQAGDGWVLRARNDSPFHISTVAATIVAGGRSTEVDGVSMIAPKTSKDFPLAGAPSLQGGAQVKFKFVSEHGSVIERTAELQAN
jgi:chaperone protein EcpD